MAEKEMIPVGGTFVSPRGYALCKEGNEACVERLQKQLTVQPKVNPNAPGADQVRPFPVYRESRVKLYMPRYFGEGLFGIAQQHALPDGEERTHGLEFRGDIRSEQRPVVEAFFAALHPQRGGGGIICLACGGGKTVTALYILSQLRRKALVICHKEFLMNQWRERIAQFLPNARVGLIKQNKVVVDDCDVVIASLQSLAMRDYDAEVFAGFHCVVYDECHHLSAEVFSRAMMKVQCKVTLGLSATLQRKDGLTKVIEWHLGKPVFKAKKRTDTALQVHIYRYRPSAEDKAGADGAEYGRELTLWNGKPNHARMIHAVCDFAPRNAFLVAQLAELLAREPGRQVILLSDRRAHLAELERRLREAKLGSIGYYVGGMKEEGLKASEGKDLLLATFSMAAEALDIPTLNTLVLASPVSSVEQAIGRIQRQKPRERRYVPYVIDVWDSYGTFQGQGKRRLGFYQKQGYGVWMDGHAMEKEEACDQPKKEERPQAASLEFVLDEDEACELTTKTIHR